MATAIAAEPVFFRAAVGDPIKVEGKMMYLITVRTNEPLYRNCALPLQVRKRYTEFVELHRALSSLAPPALPLPAIPPKTFLMQTQKSIDARLVAFQALLERVSSDPALRTSPPLARFLEVTLSPAPRDVPRTPPPAYESVHQPETDSGFDSGGNPEPEGAPTEAATTATTTTAALVWSDNPLEAMLAVVNAKPDTPDPSSPVRPRVSDKISSQPLPQPRSPSRTGPKASSAPLRPPTNKQPSKPASGFRAFSEDFASAMKHAGEQEPVDVSGEALRAAIKRGNMEVVKDLLEKGVDPNFRDQQGMSLLHVAAIFNISEAAILLCEAGARIDVKNNQGETAVELAPVVLAGKLKEIFFNRKAPVAQQRNAQRGIPMQEHAM